MFNILDDIGLYTVRWDLGKAEGTYVLNFSHDVHFHVDFLIQHTILHETSFLELLRSIWNTIELGSDLVHDSKSSLANRTNLVILVSTTPLLDISTNRRIGLICSWSTNIRGRKDVNLQLLAFLIWAC